TGLLFNPKGELVGAVLSCRDITERKRMEDQMHRQERLAALGKLVAGVAHEIRNPLTAISGYIQFWKKHNNPSPQSMDVIAREVARLNGLVEKLLFFSRPPEARFTLQDVNDLVERVLAFFRATGCDGLDFRVTLAPDLPPVAVDPEQMEQALANVIYNACQAMPRGGVLRVSTSAEPEGGWVVVAVADEGPGIPPEHLPHLFDPFFTTKPKGAGLGLAITHEIVRAHGGTVEVESTVGAGSVFRILIPVAEGRGRCGADTRG
ncbi:MAG: two-component system sensor histidine kinase AtoS, partial [Firmicutes bacterium]|nr:two-component system sensor histidine kinase AtoS [Bacillota bacterium]